MHHSFVLYTNVISQAGTTRSHVCPSKEKGSIWGSRQNLELGPSIIPLKTAQTFYHCIPVEIHLLFICIIELTTFLDSRDQVGALLTWKAAPSGKTTILARVGVSLISSAQACANSEAEIPDFSFERVKADARKQWNELLGRVRIDPTGVDTETIQLFYSSVSVCNRSPCPCSRVYGTSFIELISRRLIVSTELPSICQTH